jgi:hypothetical protein
MGCVLAVCTCYFVDRSGSGWCSCRGVEHCCGGCVRLGTCLGGWACCFCVASFQSAVLAGDTKKAAKALMFLPPNMGSGVCARLPLPLQHNAADVRYSP